MRTTLLAVVLAVSAASSVNAQSTGSSGVANAIPPNYRQLIVQKILESTDQRNIRRARISQPHEQWAGLFSGGNQPTICVEVIRQTILTSDARDVWAFTFRDGRIATATYSNADCGDYAPFSELLKPK
ncbi:MAG TPA: hypothetical protein VLX44_17025 [Xanthobacteraceae bacterium]|nr:hypothetical protein [Xanthobacteraceae bacterium]